MFFRPGGSIYIGEINDEEKRHIAEEMRRKTHGATTKVSSDNPDHLYFSKSYFMDLAAELGLEMNVVDHTDIELSYPTAPYRYSVYAKVPDT